MTADGPLSTTHLPRPDPARGVFETLLVVDGRPIELDAHLDRLALSVRELFGAPAMARIAGPARVLTETRAREFAQSRDAARSRGATQPRNAAQPRAGAGAPASRAEPRPETRLTRLRLEVAPNARGSLDLSAVVADVDPATVFPGAENGVALAPVTVAGGLGAHKWADRRLLDGAAALFDDATGLLVGSPGAGRPPTPGPPQPLLVDSDDSVLETARANVFAVHGGALITPPADGRILPGVTRARTIEIARALGIAVAERRLVLDDLRDADELFLTGSVRGIEPVGALAGAERAAGGPLTDRLASALRERWLGAPAG